MLIRSTSGGDDDATGGLPSTWVLSTPPLADEDGRGGVMTALDRFLLFLATTSFSFSDAAAWWHDGGDFSCSWVNFWYCSHRCFACWEGLFFDGAAAKEEEEDRVNVINKGRGDLAISCLTRLIDDDNSGGSGRRCHRSPLTHRALRSSRNVHSCWRSNRHRSLLLVLLMPLISTPIWFLQISCHNKRGAEPSPDECLQSQNSWEVSCRYYCSFHSW